MRAVIDARGVHLDRERDAARLAELIAVHAKPKAGRPRTRQDRARLIDVEGAAVTEDVGPLGLRRAGIEHRTAHHLDVGAAVVCVLRRHDVGAEERDLVAEDVGDVDESRLAVNVERVARLDLDGGDAAGAQFAETLIRCATKFLTRRRTRGVDGSRDAAPVVRDTSHARLELIGPLAGEDQVRMRVDEAGYDRAVLRVDPLVRRRGVRVRTDPEHDVVVDHHCRIQEPAGRSLAQRRIVRRQFTDVLNDPSRHHPSCIGIRTPRSSAVCSASS